MEISPWVLARHYKDTLKTSLKKLKINPATWEDLARNQVAWRRTVKTGAAIYEANRIATAKTKRAARKSPAPQTNTANALPTCPRHQSKFRARISLVGHLRTEYKNNQTIPTLLRNPLPHPWHQFHFSQHHRDQIPILITCLLHQ
ncbi:unnamed protein product [Schistocephalus solidus]|uniref:Regulatory protein zeste n=1 Tax=Schistocephalus solidus TaxID=70667 RepID=A0A183TLP6_SCHSO|nr:unnamed protein product [Schistocephalus solidus]